MFAAATFVAGCAAAGLLAVQIALASIRVRSAARRAEAVWFMLFLGAALGVAASTLLPIEPAPRNDSRGERGG